MEDQYNDRIKLMKRAVQILVVKKKDHEMYLGEMGEHIPASEKMCWR